MESRLVVWVTVVLEDARKELSPRILPLGSVFPSGPQSATPAPPVARTHLRSSGFCPSSPGCSLPIQALANFLAPASPSCLPDYSQLHAQIPAPLPRSLCGPPQRQREVCRGELQNLRVRRDALHCRHCLPEPQGEALRTGTFNTSGMGCNCQSLPGEQKVWTCQVVGPSGTTRMQPHPPRASSSPLPSAAGRPSLLSG